MRTVWPEGNEIGIRAMSLSRSNSQRFTNALFSGIVPESDVIIASSH
jgi:hypothetical protein